MKIFLFSTEMPIRKIVPGCVCECVGGTLNKNPNRLAVCYIFKNSSAGYRIPTSFMFYDKFHITFCYFITCCNSEVTVTGSVISPYLSGFRA